jgi:hypothetical protein
LKRRITQTQAASSDAVPRNIFGGIATTAVGLFRSDGPEAPFAASTVLLLPGLPSADGWRASQAGDRQAPDAMRAILEDLEAVNGSADRGMEALDTVARPGEYVRATRRKSTAVEGGSVLPAYKRGDL